MDKLLGEPKKNDPIYRNFEYQIWESEFAKSPKSTREAFVNENIEKSTGTEQKIESPNILKEIQDYLSYDIKNNSLNNANRNLTNEFNIAYNYQKDIYMDNNSFKENTNLTPYYFSYNQQLFPTYLNSEEILTGRIKFFDYTQNYGFFIIDKDGSDLFVHYDNFLQAGINREYIQFAKTMNVRFSFKKISYYGKYNLSFKAVNIQIIQNEYEHNY